MKYIIRLDDICPQMNWEMFWAVKDVFKKYDVKPVLGVIPENKDDRFKGGQPIKIFRMEIDALIRDGWEIAQHGHTHELTHGSGDLGLYPSGEFPGLSLPSQLSKIKKGKEILEEWGWKVSYFYPPAHAYDSNTIAALKQLKFKSILDGIGLYPWNDEGLIHIPQIWWRPSQIPAPLRDLNGTIVICLHPNLMKKQDVNNLEWFLQRQKSKITNVANTIKEYNGVNSKVNELWNKAASVLFYTIRGRNNV